MGVDQKGKCVCIGAGCARRWWKVSQVACMLGSLFPGMAASSNHRSYTNFPLIGPQFPLRETRGCFKLCSNKHKSASKTEAQTQRVSDMLLDTVPWW